MARSGGAPRKVLIAALGGAAILASLYGANAQGWFAGRPKPWTEAELSLMRSLALDGLPALPPDPSNRVADDPAAAALGRVLFHDKGLSANGEVACVTCHLPDRQFQDDLPLGRGVGEAGRRTMPLAGMAHSPWLFWDGRTDSLWSQALGPLESAVEHGADRTFYAHRVAADHRAAYEAVFGPLPDLSHLPPSAGPNGSAEAQAAWLGMSEADRETVNRIFVNMGKAIAAYERGIAFTPARFDRYVAAINAGRTPEGDAALSDDEISGLRLFLGKAQCINCHNGPLLTDNHFHNTGVPPVPGLPDDKGRLEGARAVRESPFNCFGPYSDAAPSDCAELRFMVAEGEELLRAYKTPSLRNATSRPPYMHAGQLATLEDVLKHYNRAPEAPAGHSELRPLGLSLGEQRQILAFLAALESPVVETRP